MPSHIFISDIRPPVSNFESIGILYLQSALMLSKQLSGNNYYLKFLKWVSFISVFIDKDALLEAIVIDSQQLQKSLRQIWIDQRNGRDFIQ